MPFLERVRTIFTDRSSDLRLARPNSRVIRDYDSLVITQDPLGASRNFFLDSEMGPDGYTIQYHAKYLERHNNDQSNLVDLTSIPGMEGVIPVGVTISAGAGHKVALASLYASQTQTNQPRVYLHSPASEFHGVGSTGPELKAVTRIQQSPDASEIMLRIHEAEMKPYYPEMYKDLEYAVKQAANSEGDTILLNCSHPDAAKVAIKFKSLLGLAAEGKRIAVFLTVTDHVDHEIWKLPVDGIFTPDEITANNIKVSMLEKIHKGAQDFYELYPGWNGVLPDVINLGGYPIKPGYDDEMPSSDYYHRRGHLGGSEKEPIRMAFRFGGATAQMEMYISLIENLREYFPNYVPIVFLKAKNNDPQYINYIKRLKAAGVGVNDLHEARSDDELIDLYDQSVMKGEVEIEFTKASEQTANLQLQSNKYGGALVAITGAVQDQEEKNIVHYQTPNGGEILLTASQHDSLFGFLDFYDRTDITSLEDGPKRTLINQLKAWQERAKHLHGWINPQGKSDTDTKETARYIYLLHKYKIMRSMLDFESPNTEGTDVNPLSGKKYWEEAGRVIQRLRSREQKKPEYQLAFEKANSDVATITFGMILDRIPAAFRLETFGRDVRVISAQLAAYGWDKWLGTWQQWIESERHRKKIKQNIDEL